MADPRQVLRPGDALIVVDVQVDFCPGGALAIDGGDEVVPVLNHWMAAAAEAGVPIYLSRDWHPLNHLSFKEPGGEWPVHSLQDSPGARFHPALTIGTAIAAISASAAMTSAIIPLRFMFSPLDWLIWLNVLIQAEQIGWVVFGLQRRQARVLRAE